MLDKLIANKLPQKTGSIALTHMLSPRGRIELETTVIKMDDDRYYLVCAAFFEQRLLDHITNYGDAGDYQVINRSYDWAALALQGPKSRSILSAVTDAGLSNAEFPWLKAKFITIAGCELLAMRISYAGELGWELHGPREGMLAVYDALSDAGSAHGLTDYGSFAMNVMRMEKAFKGAGELTNEVTLPEADVMRFVKVDKGDFIGLDATIASAESTDRPWVCAYLAIEPDGVSDGHGGEAVMMDGQVVGSTSSVAYGHSVGKIMAFAYIKPEAAKPGQALEVMIMNAPRKAVVLGDAAYDSENLLPRADG